MKLFLSLVAYFALAYPFGLYQETERKIKRASGSNQSSLINYDGIGIAFVLGILSVIPLFNVFTFHWIWILLLGWVSVFIIQIPSWFIFFTQPVGRILNEEELKLRIFAHGGVGVVAYIISLML